MDDVARFDKNDRSDLFRAAAEQLGVISGIIEKDFWVCWVLRRIYTISDLPVQVYFKGGTSLSKVFGVIKRMSEDIDLVIDRQGLGFIGDRDPAGAHQSGKARRRLIKEVMDSACEFVRNQLQPRLADAFSDALGTEPGENTWSISLGDTDPDNQTILFAYPTVEPPSEYLRAVVRLELGARGDPWPSVGGTVRPYAADVLGDHFHNPDTEIPLVVSAQRTFWEKATLLHMLHHRPREKPIGQRFARHYYDLFCLARHDLGRSALGDVALLGKVAEHKMVFFPAAWAQYELARPGTLRLVPASHRLAKLRDDYDRMAEEMMFGDVPDFDAVIAGLQETERSINEKADA